MNYGGSVLQKCITCLTAGVTYVSYWSLTPLTDCSSEARGRLHIDVVGVRLWGCIDFSLLCEYKYVCSQTVYYLMRPINQLKGCL